MRAPRRVDGHPFDRRLGALLGTFVGDALGMPYEGAPPGAAPAPLELAEARLGRGTYTDDTSMAIAVAEVLAERGECDEEALAARFLATHHPGRGYGRGTLAVFELWRSGVPVAEAADRVFPGGSYGNGAAMRVAPVGAHFAWDEGETARQAARSARVTHTHPVGVGAAVAVACAVAAAIRGEDPLPAAIRTAGERAIEDALRRAASLVDADAPPGEALAALGSGVAALESVPAALWAAARARSFEEACTAAVRLGGDADTTASMAGAVAGARFGAAAIPPRWLDGLENGERGRDHVVALAERLWREAA